MASPSGGQRTNLAPSSATLVAAAAHTTSGVRHRMSLASGQLSHSLRQLYASASSIGAEGPPSYQNIPGIVPYYHGRASGPPPAYEDVVNPNAAPPTYQSLFGQMRQARKSSRGLLDLLRRLLIILVSSLGCTILIAFMILIPFSMILVGAIYIDDCKVEHIPTFLLVGGLVWASKNILHCYVQCNQADFIQQSVQAAETAPAGLSAPISTNSTIINQTEASSSSAEPTGNGTIRNNTIDQQRLKSSICESLLDCILFGWFVAGCIIVFRNFEPEFENTSSVKYCNRTVYMYTFWLITSALIAFGLLIGCICCLMVSSAVSNRQNDSDLA